jgi:hypothetical protein
MYNAGGVEVNSKIVGLAPGFYVVQPNLAGTTRLEKPLILVV